MVAPSCPFHVEPNYFLCIPFLPRDKAYLTISQEGICREISPQDYLQSSAELFLNAQEAIKAFGKSHRIELDPLKMIEAAAKKHGQITLFRVPTLTLEVVNEINEAALAALASSETVRRVPRESAVSTIDSVMTED